MLKNINDIEYVFPKAIDFEKFIAMSPVEPFSEDCIAYLDALSKLLLKNPDTKKYPEIATFGFFCRKSNILQLKKKHFNENYLSLGRGIIFHITPSNVPLNFAYSLISGLLSGNSNIVRIPSHFFEPVEVICNAINKLSLEKNYLPVSSRILLVRYNRQSTATEYFSSKCDVRIIWGGDSTIKEIRRNALPPRSFDVTFADRYSICVINADNFIFEKMPDQIATGFYNDTYLFDQNACTSPHLVVWLGSEDNVQAAKKLFWDSLYKIVKTRYNIQPITAIDKLTTFYNQAAQLKNVSRTGTPDNLLWIVTLNELPKNIEAFRCSSGFFSEYHASSISELSEIIDRKYQTLSYYGIEKEELVKFISQTKPLGIDRITPIGKTTVFSLIWDGFNLIEVLSRKIDT